MLVSAPPKPRRNRKPQLRAPDLNALMAVRRDRLWAVDDFAAEFGTYFATRRLPELIARGLLTRDFPTLIGHKRLVGITNAGERALRDTGRLVGVTGTWNDGNRTLSDPRHILELKDAMQALRLSVAARPDFTLREDEDCMADRVLPHEARRLIAPDFDKAIEADRTFMLGYQTVRKENKREWRERLGFLEWDRATETLTRGASAEDCEYLASKFERYASYFCAKCQRDQFGNESGTAVFVLANAGEDRLKNAAALADEVQKGRAPNRFLFTTAERWLADPLSAELRNAQMEPVLLVS